MTATHFTIDGEMNIIKYATSEVVVHHFDGRLHIDIKGFPVGHPMTICIEDDTIFDQDAPEPVKEAWDRPFAMFTPEGNEMVAHYTQEACNMTWPLTTTRESIVKWIQDNVYAVGLDRVAQRQAVENFGEVFDTAVREEIHEAIDAFIDGSKR